MKRIVLCADGLERKRRRLPRDWATSADQRVEGCSRHQGSLECRHRSDRLIPQGRGTFGRTDQLTRDPFGDGMKVHVRNLYRFLVYNYEPGDEIGARNRKSQ